MIWLNVSRLLKLLAVFLAARFSYRLILSAVPGPPTIPIFPDPLKERQQRRSYNPAKHLPVLPGMQVLVIEPGPNKELAIRAAQYAGEKGHVYVVDTQERNLERLNTQIRQLSIANMSAQAGSLGELPLPETSVDRALLVKALSRLEDKESALASVRRVLKPDGFLAVYENLLAPGFTRRSSVLRWCREAGFEPLETYGNIVNYVVIAQKASIQSNHATRRSA